MRRRTHLPLVAGVVLAASAWLGAVGLPAPDGRDPGGVAAGNRHTGRGRVPGEAGPAVVTRVVDGDTVRVRVAGDDGSLPAGEHRVRLLGIDTPEMNGGAGRPACGATAATGFLRSVLPAGTRVLLQADHADRDRFGRPLRYLWRDDGTFVNRAIAAAGHGHAVRYEPNDRHWEVLRAAAARARTNGHGMWGRCGSSWSHDRVAPAAMATLERATLDNHVAVV